MDSTFQTKQAQLFKSEPDGSVLKSGFAQFTWDQIVQTAKTIPTTKKNVFGNQSKTGKGKTVNLTNPSEAKPTRANPTELLKAMQV